MQSIAIALAALATSVACSAAPVDTPDPAARSNRFGDPFVQATAGLPSCPVPPGPQITAAEQQAEAHWRAERGTSCYRAGRCRLPNAYLYDAEIIPRVQRAIAADGRFGATTSVWLTGQRRWVWLQGCVASAEDAQALEQLVQRLDDVEAVVNELQVRPAGR